METNSDIQKIKAFCIFENSDLCILCSGLEPTTVLHYRLWWCGGDDTTAFGEGSKRNTKIILGKSRKYSADLLYSEYSQ